MPYCVAVDYWIAMTVIESDELIKKAQASSVHAYDKKSRKDFYSELNKNTKLVTESDSDKLLSTEDAAKKLAMGLISG